MIEPRDLFAYCWRSVTARRSRTFLSVLSTAIGIGSVVAVSAIGEGVRHFVLNEFTQFGTNLMAVNPGATATGGMPGMFGNSTRPLTMEDARALEKVRGVRKVVPLAMGVSKVEHRQAARNVFVCGLNHDALDVWKMEIASGQFLPPGNMEEAPPVAVVGSTLRKELFGSASPLGEAIRVGGVRLRVIGVLKSRGQFVGMDMDDAVYVPTAVAARLFRTDGLLEIDISTTSADNVQEVEKRATALLKERHDGEQDFTITTQDEMLSTLGNVINTVTTAVTAIGAISLLVGGVGILTIMWITVNERKREVGLLRALGAQRVQVQLLFLAEASLLGMLGGLAGLAGAGFLLFLLHLAVPRMPIAVDAFQVSVALGVSFLVGVLAGVVPARRAAHLDPVASLRQL